MKKEKIKGKREGKSHHFFFLTLGLYSFPPAPTTPSLSRPGSADPAPRVSFLFLIALSFYENLCFEFSGILVWWLGESGF